MGSALERRARQDVKTMYAHAGRWSEEGEVHKACGQTVGTILNGNEPDLAVGCC